MRNGRELIAISVLLLVFLGGSLFLSGHGGTPARVPGVEEQPNPSITNDRGTGSKGVFEWTAQRGYAPLAWRQPWSQLGNGGEASDVLLCIDPEFRSDAASLTGDSQVDKTQIGPEDAAVLRRWLSSGHTAILLATRLGSGRGGGAPSDDDTQTFADALDLVAETASPPSTRTEFAPLQPVRDTQGILSIYSGSGSRLVRTRPDALALFGDGAGAVALDIPVGKGRLIAVSDSQLFSNASLPRSENALFLANILSHYSRPGGRILFDEYHHGDAAGNSGDTVWSTLGRPLQLALIQLGLAAVALLVLLSGRFGPPIPLGRPAARTSSDYVLSLANLYRRAEAAPTALETLYRQFLRDICGRLGLPPDVSLERLAEVAAKRGQVNKEKLRGLLAACEQHLDTGKVTEAALLDLTRRMEAIRKDIGIG